MLEIVFFHRYTCTYMYYNIPNIFCLFFWMSKQKYVCKFRIAEASTALSSYDNHRIILVLRCLFDNIYMYLEADGTMVKWTGLFNQRKLFIRLDKDWGSWMTTFGKTVHGGTVSFFCELFLTCVYTSSPFWFWRRRIGFDSIIFSSLLLLWLTNKTEITLDRINIQLASEK